MGTVVLFQSARENAVADAAKLRAVHTGVEPAVAARNALLALRAGRSAAMALAVTRHRPRSHPAPTGSAA